MDNQKEAISNAVKIIEQNLPPKEFWANKEIAKTLKEVYKTLGFIKEYFTAPPFAIFQYGFAYSPEQIQRMCKITEGFDKLKSLDKRTQAIFLVYYKNEELSVIYRVLIGYADNSIKEIQDSIHNFKLSEEEKVTLGLKTKSSNPLLSNLLTGLIVAIASQLISCEPLCKIQLNQNTTLIEVQKLLQTEKSEETTETSVQNHETESKAPNSDTKQEH